MATQQQVRITAKMYETRDTVKRMFGGKWPANFAEYSGVIRRAMKRWGVGELTACLRICNTKELADKPVGQGMLIAAAVEMVEPSEGER